MGKRHTVEEQRQTLEWAKVFGVIEADLGSDLTASSIREAFDKELKSYFALSGLSRSKSAPADLVSSALDLVFKVRVLVERSIQAAVLKRVRDDENTTKSLFESNFYGFSKKQGVSVRFPLTSCVPTRHCASGCYAHDVLDAAPNAVVRGALNGCIANLFEGGSLRSRSFILDKLRSHTVRAAKAALRELDALDGSWSRRAYIRFSHVGEMSAYPHFADALADQVREVSDGHVDCVVYTRHPDASKLDPSKWIVNFTLDSDSANRRAWAPRNARVVFSAWDGVLDDDAEVNFLEHHRWSHMAPVGSGSVCPATLPETTTRSCDAVKCDLCFRQVVLIEPQLPAEGRTANLLSE